MIYNELKQHGTDDFPFELYCVSTQHPKYEMAFHWHSNLEMIRVKKGELSLTLDNRQALLKEGEIAFINSETVHGATPKACEYECIVFNLSFLKTGNASCDGFIENLLSHNVFLNEFPKDEAIVALVKRIFEEIGGGQAERYKGLGEMDKEQLWETTMDPSTRTLIKVEIADAMKCDEIFSLLMGDKVDPRREFIEKNAKFVKNLDI